MKPEQIIHFAIEQYECILISHAKSVTGVLKPARDAVQDTFLKPNQP